jgi:hypothetical protein
MQCPRPIPPFVARPLAIGRCLAFLTIVALSPSHVRSQPVHASFYQGVGTGATLELAREAALRAMSEQIEVFVTSTFEGWKRETKGEFDQSTAIRTVTRSMVTLRDVTETVERLRDGTYRVTASVSRSSVAEVFARRRDQALDHLRIADRSLAATPADIAGALRHYYRAFLLASLTPEPVVYDSVSALASIPRRMRNIVQNIRFERVERLPDDLMVWNAVLSYDGKPVGDLDVEYYDGNGQTLLRAQDSRLLITLYFQEAGRRSREILFSVEYRYADELDVLLAMADSLKSGVLFDNGFVVQIGSEQTSSTSQSPSIKPPFPDHRSRITDHQSSVTIPPPIESLLKAGSSWETFRATLADLVRRGEAVAGQRTDFDTLEGLYGAVVDRTGLVMLVKVVNGVYIDVTSRREVDLNQHADKRVTWIDVP